MAAVRRRAWGVLVIVGAIVALFGLSDLAGGGRDLGGGERALMLGLTGTSWDQLRATSPGAAHLVDWKFRSDGVTLAVLGVLVAGVAAFGLRRGERWAWGVLWMVPAWMAGTVVTVVASVEHPGFGTPVPVVSGSILGVVSAFALVAADRRAPLPRAPEAPRIAETA